VEDALGRRLLAVVHQAVDELAGQLRAEARVGSELSLAGGELAGHGSWCTWSWSGDGTDRGEQPPRRGRGLLLLDRSGALGLGAVLGAGLLAVGDAERVEHAADDVVAHAGQVADAAPAHEHDRVLLQVVAFTTDVG